MEAMNDFQVSINSDALDRSLADFQASLADESAALAAIADDLREMFARQFATEGAAGGTPWAPLAASTLRKRRGGGILVETGALRGSLVDEGAPGHVEESDGLQLLFGTDLPYAVFHQTGTRRMPARPILAIPDDRAKAWLGVIQSQFESEAPLLGKRELGGRELQGHAMACPYVMDETR